MTLIVASIKDQEAILLKDCQITTKKSDQKIQTDELNKYFTLSHNEYILHFYTAGSLQTWEKLKTTLDIENLFFSKTPDQMDQILTQYLKSDVFSEIHGSDNSGEGFVVIENTKTKFFVFYEITFYPNYSGKITPLTNGTYACGLGASVLDSIALHHATWSRATDSLFEKQANLLNLIKSKFEPLHTDVSHYERTGVSKHFTAMIIEDGEIRTINIEADECIADASGIRENKSSTTHNSDGTITVESQLSGTQLIKPYGEQLDRDGKKIEHL